MDIIRLTDPLDLMVHTADPVLLWGARGTGKTAIAHLLHHHRESGRRREPFVVLDCAGLAPDVAHSALRGVELGPDMFIPGVLQRVGKGTLVLEDIDLADSVAQLCIRDVIDGGSFYPQLSDRAVPFMGRIIATSRVVPSRVVLEPALFDRLSRFRLPRITDLPDLAPIAMEMLHRAATSQRRTFIEGFTVDALDRLRQYSWPSNYRELETAVAAAVGRCSLPHIQTKDLPPEVAWSTVKSACSWRTAA